MKRKILSLLVPILSLGAWAQDSGQSPSANPLDFQVGDIWYTIVNSSQKTCKTKAGSSSIDYATRKFITTYGNTVSGDITIPATVVKDNDAQETYTVIGIGEYGFSGATSVTISEGIQEIGLAAFIYDTSLVSVTLPESITVIGMSAFAGCQSLTEVTLPNSLTVIPNSLFTSGTSLTSVSLPANVVSIGENAFAHCTSLKSIVLPNSLMQLGGSAFYECSNLSSVTLSENLSSIPTNAFTGSKIQNLTIPANVSSIGSSAFNTSTLLEVTCLGRQTPAISASSFSSTTYSKGILKVYKTSLPLYEKSSLWNSFVNKEPIQVTPTGITLNYPSMPVTLGLTGQLTATLQPADAIGDITWSVTSSPQGALTVDQNGLVLASMLGTATVTASCGSLSASCEVTVQPNPSESVTINPLSSDLYVGDTTLLSALVLPTTIASPVTWSSSNPDIATIDASTGLLTAIAPGGALITAECGGMSGQLQINVLPVLTTAVTLDKKEVILTAGQTVTVTATLTPSNVTYPVITWETSDPNVATVSDGTITAVNVGTATIRAMCDGVTATCEVTVEPVLATEVILSDSQATIKIGQTFSLSATVSPDNTTDKTIEWVSNNSDVATVTTDGIVTAVGVGSATIIASCGNVSANCNITVEGIEADEVVINYSQITLRATQTQQLTASVPEETTDKTIIWSSNNESVATVSTDGLVTAISVGTAEITAACGNVSATCVVNVEATPVEQIILTTTENTINVGSSLTITADIYPDTATDKTLIWTSSLADVATVENGIVTGVAPGTATITATSGNLNASVTVTVLQPATSVSLNMTDLTLQLGTMEDLIATVEPSNTTDIMTWTTSSADVAVVNENGIVTALSIGSAIITVTCGDVSASCNVNVVAIPAESIVLSADEITLKENQSQQLTATVLPTDTTDPTVTWSTSNENVVTVTEDGIVTGIAAGKATITAICGDAKATCEVTVEAPAPDEVVLSYTEATMRANDTLQLAATVNGEDNISVTWTSNNIAVATVSSDGLVTALSVGSAIITATYGTEAATCLITVEPTPAVLVELDYTSVILEMEETFQLTATVSPSSTTDKTIEWVSDNTNVATVSDEGLVTAMGPGSATITAICGNVYATCIVTVEKDQTTSVEMTLPEEGTVYRVYNMQGVMILMTDNKEDLQKLDTGLYIINGRKYYINR